MGVLHAIYKYAHVIDLMSKSSADRPLFMRILRVLLAVIMENVGKWNGHKRMIKWKVIMLKL